MKRKDQYSRKLEFIIDKISLLPENIEENIGGHSLRVLI